MTYQPVINRLIMARISGILIGAIILCCVLTPQASWADTANLSILFTGDTHGHLRSFYDNSTKPVGGVAKRAIFFKEKRRHQKNMSWVTLDSGDALSGTPLSEVFKGYLDVEAMNRLGYDAMCLGVHDFDYGADVLRKRMGEAKFSVLSANVLDATTGKPLATPYVILERGNMKIAVIGLTTGELDQRVAPQNFAGLRVEDPVDTAKRLIPEIRPQANIIIALTHIGVNEDIRLASEVQDIDVIVGGMSESELHLPLRVGRTIIVHDGAYGVNSGLCKLSFDTSQQPWFRKWLDCELEPMGGKWTENTDYLTWLGTYQEQLDVQLGIVLGTCLAKMSALRVSSSETPLGNYVCDALRDRLSTDVAVLPAYYFQGDLPEGPISLGDLFTAFPLPYYADILTVTGGELKEILDDAAAQIGQAGFPQVSGLAFSIYYGKAVNVTVNGQAIDPFKSYTLATADYTAMGQLGYATMAKIQQRRYSGIQIRDIVRDKLQSGQVASASVSQRISFMARDPNAGGASAENGGTTPPPAMPQPGASETVPASTEPPLNPAANPEPPETTVPEASGPEASEPGTPPGTFTQPGSDTAGSGAGENPANAGSSPDMQRYDRNGQPITAPPVVIEDKVLNDPGSDLEESETPAPGANKSAQPPMNPGGTLPGAGAAPSGMVIGQADSSRDGLSYLFTLERIDNNYRYTLKITNTSSEPVTVNAATGEWFDFAVYEGADFLWNRNHAWFFPQSQQAETFSPGESKTYTDDWRRVANDGSALPSGSYRFVAEYKLEDEPVRLQFEAVLPN
jgi:5'-nucleotidase / UDP-sugar diphosphatase